MQVLHQYTPITPNNRREQAKKAREKGYNAGMSDGDGKKRSSEGKTRRLSARRTHVKTPRPGPVQDAAPVAILYISTL